VEAEAHLRARFRPIVPSRVARPPGSFRPDALALGQEMTMAVYGYVRVSTERQVDEGVSLGAQERALRGYALQHGLALDRVFVEQGVSGSTPIGERPAGAKLLAALRPGDAVLTPKLDRMFRSALDALRVLDQLRARQVRLHLLDLGGDVTGDGISKLVFTILSAVAEAERDRTRERIGEVKRDQRGRGRFLGGKRPVGYRVGPDGELVADAREQAALAQARELRAAGWSLRQISTALAGRGVAVSRSTLHRALADAGRR
jgi:putative DNA-invertase from lambdoid prophage Rac